MFPSRRNSTKKVTVPSVKINKQIWFRLPMGGEEWTISPSKSKTKLCLCTNPSPVCA